MPTVSVVAVRPPQHGRLHVWVFKRNKQLQRPTIYTPAHMPFTDKWVDSVRELIVMPVHPWYWRVRTNLRKKDGFRRVSLKRVSRKPDGEAVLFEEAFAAWVAMARML